MEEDIRLIIASKINNTQFMHTMLPYGNTPAISMLQYSCTATKSSKHHPQYIDTSVATISKLLMMRS